LSSTISTEEQQGYERGWIIAAQHGDLDAFNRLVASYEQRIYNLCVRMLSDTDAAADATQDAFINAYKAMGRFRAPQSDAQGMVNSFRTWLYRIASNICYDALRARKRHPSTSLDALISDSGEQDYETTGNFSLAHGLTTEGPESSALRTELSREIQRGLTHLPEDQRLALILCDIQGFSYEEIATVTNSSLGTVKSRISRARARMRDYLLGRGELLPSVFRHNTEE
jgi:RNA polymerase sigma-70 factor, ECF subfamily